MSTNKYFNLYNPKKEQNLLDDLNREVIQIHGIDCVYLPRQKIKEDLIFGEDVLAKFDDYYNIELYIKNVDGFEGQQTLFNKFGLDFKDQITFTVSRTTFDEAVGEELERPREGDLIYFPLNNALFEIRFVEHESVFYNLGERYVYDLKCEQFAYSQEKFNTGITEIDQIADLSTNKFYITIGSGSGTYEDQETIYQGSSVVDSTARARLLRHIGLDSKLEITDVWGVFDPNNGPVVGSVSGASYELIFSNSLEIENPLAENKPIENTADSIIDFTENNPFSEEDY